MSLLRRPVALLGCVLLPLSQLQWRHKVSSFLPAQIGLSVRKMGRACEFGCWVLRLCLCVLLPAAHCFPWLARMIMSAHHTQLLFKRLWSFLICPCLFFSSVVDCGLPPTPYGGSLTACPSGTGYNANCSFSCQVGYAGGGILTCSIYTLWNVTGSCSGWWKVTRALQLSLSTVFLFVLLFCISLATAPSVPGKAELISATTSVISFSFNASIGINITYAIWSYCVNTSTSEQFNLSSSSTDVVVSSISNLTAGYAYRLTVMACNFVGCSPSVQSVLMFAQGMYSSEWRFILLREGDRVVQLFFALTLSCYSFSTQNELSLFSCLTFLPIASIHHLIVNLVHALLISLFCLV